MNFPSSQIVCFSSFIIFFPNGTLYYHKICLKYCGAYVIHILPLVDNIYNII